MVQQAKHWAITLNNWTEAEYERIINQEGASYVIIGKEKGEEGTPHLQGHLYFQGKVSARKVKSIVGERAHVEIARNPASSIEYCRKDGDFVEIGTRPIRKGKRSDLDKIKELIDRGIPINQIATTHFRQWVRYARAFEQYANIVGGSREGAPEVIIYWGPTGSGKTRTVHERAPDVWIYPGSSNAVWFDGYVAQPDVLFDEFDGSYFKITYLLRLLDRYRMQVPVKGGFRNWKPKRIFITSNIDPQQWYANASDAHIAAFYRRVTSVNYMQSGPQG